MENIWWKMSRPWQDRARKEKCFWDRCQGEMPRYAMPWSVASYNFYFRFRVLDVDRIWPIEGNREVRMMFFLWYKSYWVVWGLPAVCPELPLELPPGGVPVCWHGRGPEHWAGQVGWGRPHSPGHRSLATQAGHHQATRHGWGLLLTSSMNGE